MKLVNAVVSKYRISRKHKAIRNLSDRTLVDIGYSPELVRMGRAGYPWKLEK